MDKDAINRITHQTKVKNLPNVFYTPTGIDLLRTHEAICTTTMFFRKRGGQEFTKGSTIL